MSSVFHTQLPPDLVRLKNKHFKRFPSLGSLENPTKKGILLVAKRGREVWSQWLAACPQESIDFEGTDFSKYRIKFSGFNFLTSKIRFDNSKFKNADFSNCHFTGLASFEECTFSGRSDFDSAKFLLNISFEGSLFSEISFANSLFKLITNFKRCNFKGYSFFAGAKFGHETDFSNSNFAPGLMFLSATLSGFSQFSRCVFGNGANFNNTMFDHSEFKDCLFLGWSDFSCQSNSDNRIIRRISFAGSIFEGEVNFANRIFDGLTDFGYLTAYGTKKQISTVFNSAPLFHGCKIHQDTNFTGAEFKEAVGPKSARAFRTLKLAMEQLKATREEQRFFRLEMKAERSTLSAPQRALSRLYEWCSDYGFSLWRPIVTLLLLSLAIGGIHGLLANACADQSLCAASAEAGTSDERTSDLVKYVLANIAPVPGLDKMQTELRKPLFGEHGSIAIAAILLEILHKIIALIMTFLFALGLRNLFKMKS